VKRRSVILSPESLEDLDALYFQIAGKAGKAVATSYLERLDAYLVGFELASERGSLLSNIRKGLRVVGFEGRVSIAFTVKTDSVIILRVFWGGQNWQKLLQD
jgi:toxin ParE1/3/4